MESVIVKMEISDIFNVSVKTNLSQVILYA